MEINQISKENEINAKIKKIKNSIYKQLMDKLILKRYKTNMIGLLSEIWNLKNEISLEILVVKIKILI